MKHLNTKTQFGFSILSFALCILLILLSACDGGSGSGTSDEADEASSGTGSIIFSLQWEGHSPVSAIHAALAPSGDVCVDYGIETIMADVYNSSNEVVASKSWPCSDRQGTISDVPIGSDMRIILEGTVSDIVLWRGETTGITVFAGETTQAETVTMNYIGDDTTAPTVDSTNPTNGVTDVSIYTAITATFSETMVSASVVNSSTFTLKTGATTVNGSVTYDSSGKTATFTPESNLSFSTNHTVTITTDVQDLAGNQMSDNYTWSFTTDTEPDTTPPTAGSPNPPDGATDVSVNSVITATFSEAVDPASVNASSFTLMAGTTTVSGSVTYSSSSLTATFSPYSKLSSSTTYTATITTDVQDLAGNRIDKNYTWSFTTPSVDTTPPTAGSPNPPDGATDVSVNSVITATFSEAVDPASVNASSFTLMAGTTTVSGSVTYNSSTRTATFTLDNLSLSTYTVTITTDVEDLAGNQMTDNYTWNFRTSPGTVVATIKVGNSPIGVAVTPNGSYVYVTNVDDNTVSVIQTSDNTVVATIDVGNSPYGIAVTPNGSYVYVTNTNDNIVSVIQTSDNTFITKINAGDSPTGIAVTPNGSYVYVGIDYSTVSVIQTSDNTIVATIDVGDSPTGIAVTPNGSYVYVTNADEGTVSVIQTSDNTVVTTIKADYYPTGIAVTPNGSYVYVTNADEGTVSVIQTSDNTVVTTINVRDSPYGVAVTPHGSYVYVTNAKDDTVSVIQTSDNTVVATINVDSPAGIAVTPNGSYVYVTNYYDDTVSVIGF